MRVCALVPMKALDKGKMRLSSILSATERTALQIAMASHVFGTLGATEEITEIAAVTADPIAAALALSCGAKVVPEGTPCGLNGALSRALSALSEPAPEAPETVLIVPADLPLLTHQDVARAVRLQCASGATVVVPDRHREGTNGLAFTVSRPPELSFGAGSFARHLADPGAVALPLASFARDVDLPEDYCALTDNGGEP